MGDYIEVDGLKQLNRALRKAQGDGTTKAIGRANKKVGRKLIDSWIRPKPSAATVGTGRGADIRPSARKSALVLRTGGSHRAGKTPYMQWGLRSGRRPGDSAGKRPYIQRSILLNRERVFELWTQEIANEIGLPRGR